VQKREERGGRRGRQTAARRCKGAHLFELGNLRPRLGAPPYMSATSYPMARVSCFTESKFVMNLL